MNKWKAPSSSRSTRNQGSIKMTLWGTKKVWLVFFSATFNQGFLAFKTPYFKDENQLAEICCLISQLGVCFCAIFNKIMKASWEHWKMASGRNQSAKSSHFLPYDTCAWVVQKWTIFFLVVYNMLKATVRAVFRVVLN